MTDSSHLDQIRAGYTFEAPAVDEADAPALALPSDPVERLAPPRCPVCGAAVRPGVVWFGEELPHEPFAHAEAALERADLVLSVGTSGVVQPAAGLPYRALTRGVPVVEINPAETELSDDATLVWRAPAAAALPALVSALRGEA